MSIYLFSNTLSTAFESAAARIYFEGHKTNEILTLSDPAYYNGEVPLGTSVFPEEVIIVPTL